MTINKSGSFDYDVEWNDNWEYIDPDLAGRADEYVQPRIFDINMPIHPTYRRWLNPVLKIGDLVETYNGEMGLIVATQEPEGIALRIEEANNNSYTVLVGDREKTYIGYSLKKVNKRGIKK